MRNLLVLIGVAMCMPTATAGSAVALVQKGRPAAVIVTAQSPPDTVRYAAEELQHYLERVSGARLPIRTQPSPGVASVYVGESGHTRRLRLSVRGLKRDGFRIATGPGWVAVLGRDGSSPPVHGIRNPWRPVEVYNDRLKLGAFGETGTLYGVYRLLEDACGVRWYMPGEIGTVIPRHATVAVGKIDRAVSPDFEYRYPWFCNFANSEDDARWFRRAGFGAAYPVQCIDSFAMFLKHRDAHPEYFALIDGQRDFANLSCIQGGGNLCLSNPGVARQWIEDICGFFRDNPGQYVFPLSPNDGMNRICECAACQRQIDPELGEAGKFSNYVWSFVDKVARGVAKRFPDRFIGGIAYEHYNTPPTRVRKLSPNVVVMICQARSSFVDPMSLARAMRTLKEWRTRTGNLYLWEYYLFSWPPLRGFPVFFPHLAARNLRSLNGISRGEFIEAESSPEDPARMACPGMAHLNLYLTAKLLWKADLDVDRLLEEYYARFYGPARKPMKAFWSAAETIWMQRGAQSSPVNIYRKRDLDHLGACLEKALAAAPEGSVYWRRVALIRDEFLPARRKVSHVLVTHPPQISMLGPSAGIRVDGLLDDEAWRDVEPFGFVDKDGEAPPFKTWGYAAWDEQSLYLAFLNYEPEMGRLTARATRRDQNYAPGMWEDDSVEVFLAPDPSDRARYVQFIFNAKGLVWDARIGGGPGAGPDVKWDSGAECVARREENRWVLEVRIPLRDLGLAAPVEGKRILANFFRNRYCGGPAVYGCWSPTLTIQHANPDRFGSLVFQKR